MLLSNLTQWVGSSLSEKEAIKIIGNNKILWGSDFPAAMNYCSYEQSYKYIEESSILTNEEKENILYNNAYKLFNGLRKC